METHIQLGNVLKQVGRSEEAIECYRRVLTIDSDHALAWNNLGAAFNDLGHSDRAVACGRQALQLAPGDSSALYNLANALKDLWQLDRAVQHYEQALAARSQFPEAAMNLGATLATMGRLNDAQEWLRRAVTIDPASARAHTHLANVLKELGHLEEAVQCYRRALQIDPGFDEAHSNLLFCLSHGTLVDTATLLAEHRRYGARFNGDAYAHRAPHGNEKDPERPLRIGFVSADLRRHAVPSLLEDLLHVLAASPRLSLHAYSNHSFEDEVTARLKPAFAQWLQVSRIPDAELAARIRADDIDILVDLSGHTAGHRLPLFALKPAPVQASWIGYPCTTGLSTMDYYLGDRHFLPDAGSGAGFTEQLVYLPATASFKPWSDAPPVNDLPAAATGRPAFGSFNRFNKISPAVVALWSELLRALPGSTMVLVGIPPERNELIAGRFAQHGVAPERLRLHPRCEMPRYLELHHEVDLCLDTFPYNGATTTAHALWMGVPTLTLAGDSPQGRVGASVLGLLGLRQYVAASAPDFVRLGVEAVADLGSLARLRATLRERFAASPASQPHAVARAVEHAFRLMWQRWCEGLAPTTLDVSR